MGRRAYLLRRLGPCLVAALALLVASPARAADPTLALRLERALAVPNVDPSRTAALAIDLRTGSVVFSRNESLALIPASNQKLPVAYAALALLGQGYRFSTEVVGSGTLAGTSGTAISGSGASATQRSSPPISGRSRPRWPRGGSAASTVR